MTAPVPPSHGIPLGDVEVADRIARAVRGRRGADRTPTLEQLMEAFGAGDPTPAARDRVAAALELAGVVSAPPIVVAPAGARLTLDVRPGAGGGAAGGGDGAARGPKRLVAGLVALVLLGGAAAGAASLVQDDDGRLTSLPAGGLTDGATGPTGPSGPSGASGASGATGTSGAAKPPARRRSSRSSSRSRPSARARSRERARARSRARARARAAARKRVRVSLTAAQPTYLCVDSGPGTSTRFEGTLSGSRTFRGSRVRVNVGLGSSTSMRVNGDRVALQGSPAGYDLSPRFRRPLGSGSRPDCR